VSDRKNAGAHAPTAVWVAAEAIVGMATKGAKGLARRSRNELELQFVLPKVTK
jgi:hypothetical protein